MAHSNSKNQVGSKQYARKSFAAYSTLFSFYYQLSAMSYEPILRRGGARKEGWGE